MRWAAVILVVSAACLAVPPNVDRDNDLRRDTNKEDNCLGVYNPDQSDIDGDGIGDACDVCDDGGDVDLDEDGILDGCDGCVGNGLDTDSDGIPDNCDDCTSMGVDADDDGIDDGCDDCVASGVDKDQDGLDDACDPCVTTGMDSDGDGVDDNCDPCIAGPQHDEDGDGFFDACDNCAAIANADQANLFESLNPIIAADTGDACDADPAYNIELFDAFAVPRADWYVQGAGWLIVNDKMTMQSQQTTSYRMFGSALSRFVVSTRVTAASIGDGTTIALFATTDFGRVLGDDRISCALRVNAADLVPYSAQIKVTDAQGVEVSSQAGIVGNAGTIPTEFDMILSVDTVAKTATCSVANTSASVTSQSAMDFEWFPGMSTDGKSVDVGFHYFDIITRDK